MTTRVLGLALLDDGLFDQRRGRAGLHAGAARHALGRQEGFIHAGGDVRGKAAAVDGQRERALHFLAGAHAARADDALRGIELKVGVRGVLGLEAVVGGAVGDCARIRGSRHRSRSALRAGRRRRPCPAVRNRRWPRRSGSRADGRRCKAPSRPCAAWRGGRSAYATLMPAATGVVHEAGVPRRPSISHRQRRQEPNGSRLSVAHSLGIWMPSCIGGVHDRGAFRHRDLVAVDLERHHRVAMSTLRRAVVRFLDERHRLHVLFMVRPRRVAVNSFYSAASATWSRGCAC